MYNLLDNAIKFTQEGTISVAVERKRNNDDAKEAIIVSVKDTGQGIHAEIIQGYFQSLLQNLL